MRLHLRRNFPRDSFNFITHEMARTLRPARLCSHLLLFAVTNTAKTVKQSRTEHPGVAFPIGKPFPRRRKCMLCHAIEPHFRGDSWELPQLSAKAAQPQRGSKPMRFGLTPSNQSATREGSVKEKSAKATFPFHG